MKCYFCGQDISDKDFNKITFASPEDSNVVICQECIEKMSAAIHKTSSDVEIALGIDDIQEDYDDILDEKPKVKRSKILPSQIKKYLDESVINQELAKKIISVALSNHTKLLEYNAYEKENVGVDVEKSNLLMIGSTGSGGSKI